MRWYHYSSTKKISANSNFRSSLSLHVPRCRWRVEAASHHRHEVRWGSHGLCLQSLGCFEQVASGYAQRSLPRRFPALGVSSWVLSGARMSGQRPRLGIASQSRQPRHRLALAWPPRTMPGSMVACLSWRLPPVSCCRGPSGVLGGECLGQYGSAHLLSMAGTNSGHVLKKYRIYTPSGYVKIIAMENDHRNSDFSNEQLWFSIAMLNYQRVIYKSISMIWKWNLFQDLWNRIFALNYFLKINLLEIHVMSSFFRWSARHVSWSTVKREIRMCFYPSSELHKFMTSHDCYSFITPILPLLFLYCAFACHDWLYPLYITARFVIQL